jgi:hypothetical protein
VQVTPTKVVLIDGTSLLRVSEYISPTGITGATVAYSQVIYMHATSGFTSFIMGIIHLYLSPSLSLCFYYSFA